MVRSGHIPRRCGGHGGVASNLDAVPPFPNNGLFDPQVSMNFPTGGTRPLCPYPQQARYNGSGATNDANNFSCVIPRP
jgi:hypothetical protein